MFFLHTASTCVKFCTQVASRSERMHICRHQMVQGRHRYSASGSLYLVNLWTTHMRIVKQIVAGTEFEPFDKSVACTLWHWWPCKRPVTQVHSHQSEAERVPGHPADEALPKPCHQRSNIQLDSQHMTRGPTCVRSLAGCVSAQEFSSSTMITFVPPAQPHQVAMSAARRKRPVPADARPVVFAAAPRPLPAAACTRDPTPVTPFSS